MDYILKTPFRDNRAHLISLRFLMLKLLIIFILGMTMSLAFPSSSISLLGWIGIIPLYLFIKDLRPSKAFLFGLVWGYGWAVTSFFWLARIEPFIPYAMGLVLAMFPALWTYLVALTRQNILVPNPVRLAGYTESRKYLIENKHHFRKILAVLIFSSFWCFSEWLRSWIFSGLPWNYLAVSQFHYAYMIQIASYTGIYGISFVLIFANMALAELIISFYNSITYKVRFYIPLAIYISILLVILNCLFGYIEVSKYNLSKPDSVNLKALLVQGDMPQMRFYSAQQAADALTIYSKYSRQLLPLKPDILIWPESAVPQPLYGNSILSMDYRATISSMIEKYKVPILLGTIYYDSSVKDSFSNDYKAFNSAVLIDKNDKIGGIYSKIHLVPWGEYTPGEDIFPLSYFYPWIKQKFSMGRSLSPGSLSKIFNIKNGIRASVLICFEDSYSYIARKHVMNGSNLFITITNDAWFPDSDEQSQHLAEAIFRSIENRRPMIRSGNNSGTCVINPLGIITDSIFYKELNGKKILHPDKQGRGAVIFNVPIEENPHLSFYTKYGDKFILLTNVIALLGLLWSFLQWKERKLHLHRLITKTAN